MVLPNHIKNGPRNMITCVNHKGVTKLNTSNMIITDFSIGCNTFLNSIVMNKLSGKRMQTSVTSV